MTELLRILLAGALRWVADAVDVDDPPPAPPAPPEPDETAGEPLAAQDPLTPEALGMIYRPAIPPPPVKPEPLRGSFEWREQEARRAR